MNFTQYFIEKNTGVKYIEDDSENPHHRLKSWKKVFILEILECYNNLKLTEMEYLWKIACEWTWEYH